MAIRHCSSSRRNGPPSAVSAAKKRSTRRSPRVLAAGGHGDYRTLCARGAYNAIEVAEQPDYENIELVFGELMVCDVCYAGVGRCRLSVMKIIGQDLRGKQ